MSRDNFKIKAVDLAGLAPNKLKKSKYFDIMQKKLDDAGRKITILAYESARKPAIFQCDVCDYIWTTKKGKYITYQNRGCIRCSKSINKGKT